MYVIIVVAFLTRRFLFIYLQCFGFAILNFEFFMCAELSCAGASGDPFTGDCGYHPQNGGMMEGMFCAFLFKINVKRRE